MWNLHAGKNHLGSALVHFWKPFSPNQLPFHEKSKKYYSSSDQLVEPKCQIWFLALGWSPTCERLKKDKKAEKKNDWKVR